MAAKIAAETIRSRLVDFAAARYGVAKELVRFENGRVVIANESVPFPELVKHAYHARVQLSATGYYATPKLSWDRANVKGRPFLYFAYGAACAEVTIYTFTRQI